VSKNTQVGRQILYIFIVKHSNFCMENRIRQKCWQLRERCDVAPTRHTLVRPGGMMADAWQPENDFFVRVIE